MVVIVSAFYFGFELCIGWRGNMSMNLDGVVFSGVTANVSGWSSQEQRNTQSSISFNSAII
jgi:hypothetical protein